MDARWETEVKPIFPDLVQVLDPLALRDRLYSNDLITREEFLHLTHLPTKEEMSRTLLVDILPRKGRTAYDRFVSALRATKGQEHVAEELLEAKRKDFQVECDSPNELKSKETIEELRDKLTESDSAFLREKLTNVGLRMKLGTGWDGKRVFKWETMKSIAPRSPLQCNPYERVAEIDETIHVACSNTIYWMKNGQWEEKNLAFGIASVFESEGTGYVMTGDWWRRCEKIFQWKSKKKKLKLVTEIPSEFQMKYRSVVGQKNRIFLMGGVDGTKSKRVDCFNTVKGKWEEMKPMTKGRCESSLAAFDNKIFVGGGDGSNEVECFLTSEEKWVKIKETKKTDCQLSSWNGKLVATGGRERSDVVEIYDDLSGHWLPLPSMIRGRYGHGVCATKDSKLVVVGGWGGANSVEYLKF